MSIGRWGKKWADVDEEDDDLTTQSGSVGAEVARFQTEADEHGIKTVTEYKERDGHTYRVTRHVREVKNVKWTNQKMIERQSMKKFGKAATNTEEEEKMLCVKSYEEINIVLSKNPKSNLAAMDEIEEKFYDESLSVVENLLKEQKVWKSPAQDGEDAPVGLGQGKDDASAGASKAAVDAAARKYVPPSLRGKGKGKGDHVEATLRVWNLSEEVKEGDLQDLFGQCGRLSRVYLAKDPTTYLSRGFAFITFYNREDAQKAIDRLNYHGYDNLIMRVDWAKPRA
eukprot:TRINITY_DN20740_c0_g1_i1.p1 TRINITY_DN20740_c0_g1~~TRINITY_DN20740_c0_g1_i1.p1  ORF type:complete len:283 (+),score=61.68 TRINITY_DN20740_c0_g1_i1:78-926(+)